MPTYRSVAPERRYWSDLKNGAGRTLELDPGQSAWLEEPSDSPQLELVAPPTTPARVIVPFVKGRLHPKAQEALVRLAPSAECYELGQRDDAYYELLRTLWSDGRAFVLVEQDIEIHATVLPQFQNCAAPWCLFPYPGPGAHLAHLDGSDPLLYNSLGCTRFGVEMMDRVPGLIDELPVRDWRRLDCEIQSALMARGYFPHHHWPAVVHHHVYGNQFCACGIKFCGQEGEEAGS